MQTAARSKTAPTRAVFFLLLSVVLLPLLLAGCASTPQWPSQESAARRQVLANVPFHPQARYQCGPASLAMMVNTQGIEVTPEQLVDRVYLPEREGALQVEMVAAARQFGLLVYPLAPELETLLREIDAGHPVLVLQNLRFGWWPQWHFAVVIGYDPRTETLILHSGTEAYYEQPLEAFMATWGRSERWARVMLPPDTLPATAEPLNFLLAANDLEATGQLDAAQTAYGTAWTTWPEQPAALLGLGNIAYKREQWAEASTRYLRMTRHFPGIGAGWNNLSEALSRQGCPTAAKVAAQCAQAQQPERFTGEPPASYGADGEACPTISCPSVPSD